VIGWPLWGRLETKNGHRIHPVAVSEINGVCDLGAVTASNQADESE
jgi:hypothetical protein